MERKEEKYYTTGEFAKYFGIKKDTLFYYDKIKLFCPAGVGENGYRFYTSSQIDLFWTIRLLRELNVPLKTLQSYFQAPSPEGLCSIAASRIAYVEKEIRHLQRIKGMLARLNENTAEGRTAVLGQVSIELFPAKHLQYSRRSDTGEETTPQQWRDIYEKFLKECEPEGIAYIGSVIAKEDIDRGCFGRVDRLFAESGMKKGELRERGIFAVFYHKGDYTSIQTVYPFLLEEIRCLGYFVTGDAYEEYLISEIATNCKEEFVTKISIPISHESLKGD